MYMYYSTKNLPMVLDTLFLLCLCSCVPGMLLLKCPFAQELNTYCTVYNPERQGGKYIKAYSAMAINVLSYLKFYTFLNLKS